MKKIAVFLLCFSMLAAGSLTAYADTPNTAPGKATIGTIVPGTHHITLKVTGNADVTLNGQTGTEFTVERLSQPELNILPNPRGLRIVKVTINGEDVTSALNSGRYTLAPVYEDKVLEIVVETDVNPANQSGGSSTGGTSAGSSGGSVPSGGSSVTPTPPSGDNGGSNAAPSDGGSAPSDGGATPSDGGAAPADSASAPSGDSASDNPSTGIAGGVSIGTAALLALGLFRRKHSENE